MENARIEDKPRPTSTGQQDAQKVKMVVKDGILKVADLPAVMEEFIKPIAAEGLQATSGEETQKGYDTLGYGYAWISERLIDVVGFCWRIVIQDSKITEGKSSRGNDIYQVSTDVILQLGNWKNKEIEYESVNSETSQQGNGPKIVTHKEFKIARDFEVLAETPVGHGWHKALNLADARKGALTNGFKKAAGFFGIGNDAYKKAIDEENQAIKETLAKKKSKKKEAAPVRSSGNLQIIKQKLTQLGAKTEPEAIKMLLDVFEFRCDSLDKLSDKQQKLILARILQYNAQK